MRKLTANATVLAFIESLALILRAVHQHAQVIAVHSDVPSHRIFFLTFDPTKAEQVQAVIKAAGLKARRNASPAQLAVLASMAQLRSVAHAPLEGGGSTARTHFMTPTHCSGGRSMKLSDFTHNLRVGDNVQSIRLMAR